MTWPKIRTTQQNGLSNEEGTPTPSIWASLKWSTWFPYIKSLDTWTQQSVSLSTITITSIRPVTTHKNPTLNFTGVSTCTGLDLPHLVLLPVLRGGVGALSYNGFLDLRPPKKKTKNMVSLSCQLQMLCRPKRNLFFSVLLLLQYGSSVMTLIDWSWTDLLFLFHVCARIICWISIPWLY